MAYVADMEIEAERAGPRGDAVTERRGVRRIQRAGSYAGARPNGAGGDNVREGLCGDDRTADVLETVSGKGAEEGIHAVDRFDSDRKAKMEDALLKFDGFIFHLVPIFIHEDYDAGQIPCCVIAFLNAGIGVIGVIGHVLGFLIYPAHTPGNDVRDAVELLPPFPAIDRNMCKSRLLPQKDESGGPAIFEIQFRQGREDSRCGHGRKALDGDDLDEFTSHLWDGAAPEFLSAKENVQIIRTGRQMDRVRDAGNAAFEMLEKIVVIFRDPVFPLVCLSLKSVQRECRGEAFFKRPDVLFE